MKKAVNYVRIIFGFVQENVNGKIPYTYGFQRAQNRRFPLYIK